MWRLDDETWLFSGVSDHPDARAALLRQCLAEVLRRASDDIVPDDIMVGHEPGGRPVLVAPAAELWVSLGGRDGMLAIAVSRLGPVGVDVETLARCEDGEAVAEALFAPAESAWLEALLPRRRPEAFARLWTGKEAVLKALGRGIIDGVADPDFAARLDGDGDCFRDRLGIEMDGASHTLVWYTTIADDAFVMVARAEASAGRPTGLK